jgi:membrane protein
MPETSEVKTLPAVAGADRKRPRDAGKGGSDGQRVTSADLWRAGRVLGFRRLAYRLWQRIYDYDVLSHAAELAYYFLLSVFPLLLFLATLLGYLATEGGELRAELLDYIARVSPSGEITRLLRGALEGLRAERSGWKLFFGLLMSLWLASNGIAAVGRSLNTAYHLKETRHWLIQRLWAVVLVLFASVLVAASLLLILFGQKVNAYLGEVGILGARLSQFLGVFQWVVVLVLVIFAFEVIYNFAPAVWQRRHLWLTPGAVAALVLWLAASLGLRTYLGWDGGDGGTGGRYALLYGSLGTVISLMFWFYLSAAAILVGGVVNGEILQALEEERQGEV